MDPLQGLNQQQQYAVRTNDGPTLIIAGPGTGKTKTLTARIAFLLETQKIDPKDIVAVTFTTKAAQEMRARLQAMIGREKAQPNIATFHALGYELLRLHNKSQKIIPEPERLEIIRSIAKPQALKGVSTRELGRIISQVKTTLTSTINESYQQLLDAYNAELQIREVLDFDDLVARAYDLLRSTKQFQPTYLLVDEFQDTSELQYEFLKLLCPSGNIYAIGDPNQSIYAFRGAGAMMFTKLRTDFPAIQEITLTTNYRSMPQIIRLANTIFPDSPQLQPHTQSTGTVQALQTLNEYSEAAYIINEIEKGIGGSDMLKASGDQDVRQLREYAVLYRTHRAARILQRAFAESGIPYQVAGEGSPYEHPVIQTVIACLQYLYDPKGSPLPTVKNCKALQVKLLLEKITITDDTKVYDAVTRITDSFSIENSKELQQLSATFVQFGSGKHGLKQTLEHIRDISQSEFYDPTIDAVTLLTIHSSKGLEFRHVFLCAANEGVLPKETERTKNIDEERRLFYVAVTRAKENLDIIYTKNREHTPVAPSRFLTVLSPDILPQASDPAMDALEKRLQKRRQKSAQISLF